MWRVVGIVGLLAIGLWPAEATATVREWLMAKVGIEQSLLRPRPSVRLMGLGDLDIAVADESNELNAADFGDNIAGLLADDEGWVMESWLGNAVQNRETGGVGTERRFGEWGLHVVRSAGDRALGAQIDWTHFETVAPDGDRGSIRGPLISAIVNQRIRGVTLGMRIGTESESESRTVRDFFAITHGQERWIGALGACTRAFGFDLGAEWTFERGDVIGKGIDKARFHEDTFTWKRPLDRYSLFVLLPLRDRVEGGVRVAWYDRRGYETVMASWSDGSPMNPSKSRFIGEAVTFSEEESEFELESRWRVHPAAGTVAGVSATYRSWDSRIEDGVNFKGSEEQGARESRQFTLGVGAQKRLLGGRLSAALEARAGLGNSKTQLPLEETDGDTRSWLAGCGVEYFASRHVVLRAGLSMDGYDRDVDEPLTLLRGRTVSGGVAWVPRGGLIQVQGAIQHRRTEPADDQATGLEEGDQIRYTVGLRALL